VGLRLMGLPPVARYPNATVSVTAEELSIRFDGAGEERTMAVPRRLLDAGGDAEEASLRLMASLQALGYAVRPGEDAS
jgi:hypothetical protein